MSNDTQPAPEVSHGELMAVGFLLAFFRKVLREVSANELEFAEARLPTIARRLRNDPDVLDNGTRFHLLAEKYLPCVDREEEDFISLLEAFSDNGFSAFERRFFARDRHVESLESRIHTLQSRIAELETERRSLPPEP